MSRAFIIIFLTLQLGLASQTSRAAETFSLAGKWRFALDRQDVGTNENWAAKTLPDTIQLPGILEAQDFGDAISPQTPWVLSLYDHFWHLRADYAAYTNAGKVKVAFLCQPPRHYLGAAWYQHDLEIPKDWNGRRVGLFLERPHWKSTVWLDDREIGSDISLCTPHEFELGRVAPGRHRLTIRVDNRMILPYRPDAHSVSDSLDNAWNGIVGKMELRATDDVFIQWLDLTPDLKRNGVEVVIHTHNGTGHTVTAPLVRLQVVPKNFGGNALKPMQQSAVIAPGETNLTLFFPMGGQSEMWSEFNPKVYSLRATLGGKTFHSEWAGTFGLRDFRADGNQFILNGRPIYLRGTHFGGDFPLTGYPPTDVASWKKMFQTCKDWGLNHMRFHSWCPPEAAFTAADELGFYLQVEPGMWNPFAPGSELEKMLYAETDRIIRAYGNHPSFLLLSASNEAGGHWKECLPQWVGHFRTNDPRRLYTPDTGWSLIDEPGPVNGADYLAVGRVGPNRVRGESGWFGRDYGSSVAGVNVPVVAHELGQWCAYPDFSVIRKFTGFMQAGNYEIFRDSAKAHGVLDRNQEFAWASGRFQLACYKEEVEANLRTPGLAGFQLLDLHDYTGQGTALVGLLDPFWETKGYATAAEFKKFCGPVVPLARLKQRVFTTADTFAVPVEAANYGATTLTNVAASWQILNAAHRVMAAGLFEPATLPIGKNLPLGTITTDLAKLPAPGQYRLVVSGSFKAAKDDKLAPPHIGSYKTFTNDWNFWLYPAIQNPAAPVVNVLVTSSWPAAEKNLATGGKVLFTPRLADLSWHSPPLARVPVFWNALMGPTWSRMLGLWCDTNSPALAQFPTAANGDWQWAELVRNARAINLDHLPHGLTPIVSAIDDWNRNYKLGVIFEAKVGAGKLLVCAIDLDARPGAQQLRRSLLDYMASDKFSPATVVSTGEIHSFLFDNLVMRKLGATVTADGKAAPEMADGDPNTFWSSDDAKGKGPLPPHEIKIAFTNPVAMSGLLVMPRQNHREHQGDIREYRLEQSDDGVNWQPLAHGELASTFDPQTIAFGQTITTRHLRFTALNGFGADKSAALAELAVLYAGPALPENTGGLEYRHVRTASTDIDAGEAPNQPKKARKK